MSDQTYTQTAELTLADWLLARIAEDEAVALAAGEQGPFAMSPSTRTERVWSNDQGTVRAGEFEVVDYAGEMAPHIARWDPARVLAECEAKRQIVTTHKTIASAYPGTTIETDPCCSACSAGGEYPGWYPCATLRALALPYADHPGYRDEWRP